MEIIKSNKNKIKKTLVILVCIIFSLVFITTSIISADIHHLGNCDVQNCNRCILIHNSIGFLQSINSIVIYFTLLYMIFPLTYITKQLENIYFLNTLINLKVQFNE